MTTSSHNELVSLLGANSPLLKKINPDDQEKLLTLLHAARKSQNSEYSIATEKALQHVPALLRGTVRKIIAG